MRRGALWIGLAVSLAAGCTPTLQRERTTFAVLAGTYYSAVPGVKVEAAMVEESEMLLGRAVADLNARKDLDFVVVAGDLLARSDPLSLDRAKAALAELHAPYYVVLGDYDGPGSPVKAAELSAPKAEAATPTPAEGGSRGTVIWAFQGHGFSGSEGYWVRAVPPDLVLVGLDTVRPGRRGGHVDARQLAWLDRTLTRYADKVVVVVAHHGLIALHPLDEGTEWRHLMVDNAAAVRDLLGRHPNVLMVVTGHHHFAGGQVAGPIVYLASPSAGVWPLAYHLVRLTPKQAEAVWVPLTSGDLARRALEKLLDSREYRGVFPKGEDGETACVRLFGGNKMKVYPLPAIRP